MAEVCLASTNGTCICTGSLPKLPEDPSLWMCPQTTTTVLPTNMTTTELPTTPNMTVTQIVTEMFTNSTSLTIQSTSVTSTMTTLTTEKGPTTPTDKSNDALIVGLSVGFTLLVIFIATAVVLLVLRHRKKRRSEQDDKEGLPVNGGDETDGNQTVQGKDNDVTKDGLTAQNGTEGKQHEPKKTDDVKPDQGGTATSPKPTDGAGSDSNQGHGEVQTTSL